MKNKKGFTMVELLAVIAILAILIIIAIPTYNVIKNNMEKRSSENYISYLELQAEKFITNEQVISEVNEFDINVQNLIDYGYLKEEDPDLQKLGTDYECMIIHIKVKGNKVVANYKEERNCEMQKALYLSKIVEINAFDFVTKEEILPYGDPESKVLYNPNLNWTNHDVLLILKPGERGESKINKENITEVAWSGPNLEETRTMDDWLDDPNSYNEHVVYKNAIKLSPETIMNDTTYRVNVTIEYENQNGEKEVDYVQTYIVVRIDKERPVVSAHVSDIVTNQALKARTIYIEGDDFEGSGVDYFCFNDQNVENCSDLSARIKADKDERATTEKPNGTYYIWAVDKVGNISLKPAIITVKETDDIKPRCRIDGERETWGNTNVTLTFTCVDDESGCVETTPTEIVVKDEGMTYDSGIVYHDKAGNEVVCDIANVYIDKTKPECEVNTATTSTTWSRQRKVEVKCLDNLSGCTKTKDLFRYGTLSTDSNMQYAKVVTYNYTITDKAGNTNTCGKTANVYVDNVPPTIKITNPTIPVAYKEGTTFNTTITLKDNNKLVGYQITDSANIPSSWESLNSTMEIETKAITKTGKFYVHTKDVAGNITSDSYNINCPFKVGETYNLSYTGYPLKLNTDLCGGNFTFTLYGAQGKSDSGGQAGGKGAKTVGTMTVNKKDSRFFYIGGQGKGGHTTSIPLTYNGVTKTYSGNYIGAGSFGGGGYSTSSAHGGGATDIRTSSGNYYDQTSMWTRIMVAAGGGGGGTKYAGGAGGAPNGGNAGFYSGNERLCAVRCVNDPPSTEIAYKSCGSMVFHKTETDGRKTGECFSNLATGGTLSGGGYYGATTHYQYYKPTGSSTFVNQTGWWSSLPGDFGLGGWGNASGGGGGGWYGGGGGSTGAFTHMSGGGGSSCISSDGTSYNCPRSDNPLRFTNTSMEAGVNSGDGKASIYVNSVIE